jgi:hypothetical protein
VAVLAIETGIPPSVLWLEDASDLATMVRVLEDRAKK